MVSKEKDWKRAQSGSRNRKLWTVLHERLFFTLAGVRVERNRERERKKATGIGLFCEESSIKNRQSEKSPQRWPERTGIRSSHTLRSNKRSFMLFSLFYCAWESSSNNEYSSQDIRVNERFRCARFSLFPSLGSHFSLSPPFVAFSLERNPFFKKHFLRIHLYSRRFGFVCFFFGFLR